jgi:hypothetical protein
VHAVVVTVTVSDREAAQQRLEQEVVPGVSQAPGFQAGYWTSSTDNSGLAMVIFDSEENARASADRVPSTIPEGVVTLEGVEVREVVASA